MGQDTATYDNDLAGSTAFVLVLWSSDGRIVNATTGVLMTANNTNAPSAAILMSDSGHPNLYQVLYPPNGTPAGRYSASVYQKAGASLVLTGASRDKPVTESVDFVWGGAAVIPPDPGVPSDLSLCRCSITNFGAAATYSFDLVTVPTSPLGGYPVPWGKMDAAAGALAYGDLPRGGRARVSRNDGRGSTAFYDFDVPNASNFSIDHSLLSNP